MPKRYFWLKLKENFFESDDIRVILTHENGPQYVIFWMKLLLKAISREDIGKLRYKERVPYTPDLLATVTNTDIDHVKGALTLFHKLGMVEMTDDGTLWVEAANELVGTETDAAARMRRLRERKTGEIEDKRNNHELSDAERNNVTQRRDRKDVEKRREESEKIQTKRREEESEEKRGEHTDPNKEGFSITDDNEKRYSSKMSPEDFEAERQRQKSLAEGLVKKEKDAQAGGKGFEGDRSTSWLRS